MQEIELTFLVPPMRVKGMMRQVHVKSSQEILLSAYYFDTPKQTLAQAGIGLRIRQENDKWVQTIKAYGDGIAARLEHNALLDNEQVQVMLDNGTLMPDLSIYTDTIIEPVLVDFNLKKLTKKLMPLYMTQVQRTTRLLTSQPIKSISQNNKNDTHQIPNRIEMAYDCGQIVLGKNDSVLQPIQEIEFELISGELGFLFTTAKTWCKHYHLCLSTVTKAERGGLLMTGQTYSAATHADLKQLNIKPNSHLPAFVRAAVHNCLLQILPNSSAIVAGSQDSAHIAQLQIGIRRLCVALSAFKKFSNQLNVEWLPILKQTEAPLTTYHKLAQLAQTIQPKLKQQGAPIVDWMTDMPSFMMTLNETICANNFQLTLLELIEFTMSPSDDEPQAQTLAQNKLPKILSKKQKALQKAIHHFNETNQTNSDNNSNDAKNIDQQNNLTDLLTELRHLSEFAAPLRLTLDGKSRQHKPKAKRYIKQLTKTQKTLGQYFDNHQYQQYYLQKSTTDTNALYGVGYFSALSGTDKKRCKKRLASLLDTTTFW